MMVMMRIIITIIIDDCYDDDVNLDDSDSSPLHLAVTKLHLEVVKVIKIRVIVIFMLIINHHHHNNHNPSGSAVRRCRYGAVDGHWLLWNCASPGCCSCR